MIPGDEIHRRVEKLRPRRKPFPVNADSLQGRIIKNRMKLSFLHRNCGRAFSVEYPPGNAAGLIALFLAGYHDPAGSAAPDHFPIAVEDQTGKIPADSRQYGEIVLRLLVPERVPGVEYQQRGGRQLRNEVQHLRRAVIAPADETDLPAAGPLLLFLAFEHLFPCQNIRRSFCNHRDLPVGGKQIAAESDIHVQCGRSLNARHIHAGRNSGLQRPVIGSRQQRSLLRNRQSAVQEKIDRGIVGQYDHVIPGMFQFNRQGGDIFRRGLEIRFEPDCQFIGFKGGQHPVVAVQAAFQALL